MRKLRLHLTNGFCTRSAQAMIFAILSIGLLIQPLQASVALQSGTNPDFDGNGMVDFPDFLEFVGKFGSRQGDEKYEDRFDLNGDDEIEFQDFLSFVSHFGKAVPVAAGTIDPVMLTVGDAAATVDMSGNFSDADSETLTYSATTSDEAIATASVAGSEVTISPVAAGSATVTVTATDPGGLAAAQTIEVTVQSAQAPRKMYWSEGGPVGSAGREIQRANLDGSNIEVVITAEILNSHGIALDIAAGKMYHTDGNSDKIRRFNLDGTGTTETLVETRNLVDPPLAATATAPMGIALDLANNKMYWADQNANKIQRADLDGSNVEDLVTGLDNPYAIALDLVNNKMYWSDWGTDKIQRVDLMATFPVAAPSSDIQDVITAGVGDSRGIALDVAAGKIYYTDRSSDRIRRADLDGSNIENNLVNTRTLDDPNSPLVTGQTSPHGIALDVAAGKMYWTDIHAQKIYRANLDSTDPEELVTGLVTPLGIAVVGQ